MVSRAMWKGQLRLSLVSIPVELFSATKSGGRTSFRQIRKPTGKPIHYENIVEGVGASGGPTKKSKPAATRRPKSA